MAKANASAAPAKRRQRKKGPGLSFQAFSEAADISVEDVARMAADGTLKVVQLGKLKRIPRSELERIQAELG